MYALYELLARAADLGVSPVLRLPRFTAHRERLGLYAPAVLERLRGGKVLWLHNASVGELLAARPLLRRFRDELAGWRLVVSATSFAGRDLARTLPEADAAVLLPLDLPGSVARALDAIQPSLFVFTETEIWPTLLRGLRRRAVPAVLVSGRLSPRAFLRYRRLQSFFRRVLADISFFGMQSAEEAERMLALGADPERLQVTGSLKLEEGAPAEPAFRVASGRLWIAASTHAGEEEACARAFARLRARFPDLRLLLAPRHLERLGEVERVLAAAGVPFARRSALDGGGWSGEPPVLLLDTLGELAELFAGATAAFVGGTLAPVGGHNLAEPARAGVPVLFGPHVESVAAAAGALEATGGGARVRDAAELERRLAELLADPSAAARMAEAARRTFAPQASVEASFRAVARFLERAA